jgi:NAD(P)-dependent dehydrogenase (short-subunit alcohol dehydrogenase family)
VRYWIIGYGGIGEALVRQLLAEGHDVVVFSSSPRRNVPCVYEVLDITDRAAVENAFNAQTVLPDQVINTVGRLHDDQHMPEKRLLAVTEEALVWGMRMNVLGTLHCLQALEPRLSRDVKMTFVMGYHPGTVSTGLSAPFVKQVPENKLFSPDQAAGYCLDCLAARTASDSGGLFDWQGIRVDF